MEKERKRVCCNCRHCIRIKDSYGMVTHNECEIDKHYIGYIATFDGWCRHWSRENETNKEKVKINYD